ncbi:MAG: GrpB family protein [Patescibacteria group bacterium]
MELDKNIKRKYLLEQYNPEWVEQFEVIKKRVEDVFGEKALSIEHVGSTSIHGMFAKPLIDVLVSVENIENLQGETGGMESLGYLHGRDYIEPRSLLFFKMTDEEQKLENIHVCEKGSAKTKQFLIMRDFFRAFPDKAKEYSDLKRKNFEEFPDDYPAYRAAKTPFLQKAEQEAYEWNSSLT